MASVFSVCSVKFDVLQNKKSESSWQEHINKIFDILGKYIYILYVFQYVCLLICLFVTIYKEECEMVDIVLYSEEEVWCKE